MKRIYLLLILPGFLLLLNTQKSNSQEFKTYLQNIMITDIADAGDYLWLTVWNSTEVIKFEKSTGLTTIFDYNDFNISPNKCITSIECDENGIPYVGTYAGSFKLTENNQWEMLHPGITADIISSNDGVVWIANDDELLRMEKDSIREFDFRDYEFYAVLTSMALDKDGILWGQQYNEMALYGELVKFDGQSWTTYHMPEYNNSDFYKPGTLIPSLKYQCFISDIQIDSQNKIWMARHKSNPGGERVILPDGSSMNPSKSELVVLYRGGSWATFNPPIETVINSITPDNGTIWCNTDDGLMLFNNSQWTVYNTENSGLPYNQVNSVLIDNDGTKWIGTNKGLVSLIESDSNSKSNETTAVEPKSKLISEFDLFPNPANDYITIKKSQEIQNLKIDILNIQGKTIKTFNLNNNETRLDVSSFPAGVYLVRIQQNENHFMKKFVKQ